MKSYLLVLIISTTGFFAKAENYKLDTSHTEIGFSVKHLLISNVKGRFGLFSGTFEYNKANRVLENLKIEIDPASISTNQKDRDEHLRSDEFFDVEKFKKVTFIAEKATLSSDGQVTKVKGKLKIKETELPVTLDVVITGEAEIEGTQKIAFTANTEINRKKWGINWNEKLDKGGVAVSEEVKIIIEGQANLIKNKTK